MSLFLTACGGGGGGGSTTPVYDLPSIVATPSALTVTEDGSTTFDVVLNTEPTADVDLSVTSSDLSEATASVSGLVFTSSAGATPWNVPQTVTVSGVLDDTADGNQNINVVLDVSSTTDTDYAALAATNVAATVTDVDSAGITVRGADLITSEDGTTASFDVQLNTIPDGVVQLNITSSDITEGDVSSSTLVFDANNWNMAQTVIVTPASDGIADGTQTYPINLVVDTSATTDTTGYAAVTLNAISVANSDIDTAGITVSTNTLSTSENGASASYSVVLNTMPDADVVVDVQSGDPTEGTTSPATLTFTALNWNTPQLVMVSPADDYMADGNQTYNVSMGVSTTDTTGYAAVSLLPVSVTNADDDTAGITVSQSALSTTETGSPVSYTVVLNTQPDADVVIDVVSGDDTEGTVSPAALTFTTADWSTPQTVTVTPVNDDMADGNQTYNVSMGVSTTDTTGYAAVSLLPVSVTNADDDTAGITVSQSALSTTETGSPVSYTVVLNTQPDADVVIDVVSGDDTEGTVSPAALTFTTADWSTPQTVTVTPVNDDMADGNQSYDISMSVTLGDSTGYNGTVVISPVNITNADDDTAGVSYSPIFVSTVENGAPATFTMVLNTQPDGDVVIDVASGDITEGTVSPATLTFNNLDWQTPQTVTVTPVDDVDFDGQVVYNVSTSVNTGSTLDTTGYAALTLFGMTVINDDDDAASFTPEGTSSVPVSLAFGADLPHAGSVDTTDSYYEITGLTPGGEYNISLTGMTDDGDLYVYTDAFSVLQCSSAGSGDETCASVFATTGSLWVRVNGSWATANGGTGFTLDVATPAPPVVLTHTVAPGFVDYDVQAAMSVEFAVTTGTSYTIQWDDAWDGSGSYAGDIVVDAIYSDGNGIFIGVDSGYTTPQSFTASQTGTVTLTLDPAYATGLIGLQVTSP